MAHCTFYWHKSLELALGVSICLNVVRIETLDLDIIKQFVSTVEKILTFSKSSSQQSRNLDRDRDFSISSRHQCPDLKVSIEIKKFDETWKFHHFSTVCLDLDQDVSGFLNISCQDFSICQDFSSFSYSKCLHNVKISQQISICLDKSWQSRFVLTILMISTKILTRQSLDWKVSILKILTETKKKFVSTVEKISTGFKSLSQQIEKSRSQFVSTVETTRLNWSTKQNSQREGIRKRAT